MRALLGRGNNLDDCGHMHAGMQAACAEGRVMHNGYPDLSNDQSVDPSQVKSMSDISLC